MSNKISIIIPTLNEAAGIGKLLTHLDTHTNAECIEEVIISDGGSRDSTCEIASGMAFSNFSVKIVTGAKGRARQQNLGASLATGNILYFLHADSFPPGDFDKHILRAIREGASAGCFRLRFDEPHILLRFSQWFTRFNFLLCRGGDQSLFIRKEVFEILDGFNEAYFIYEDGELHHRIYDQINKFRVLKPEITTSARRYHKNGFWTLQYHFTRVHLMYRMGYGPGKLFEYYQKNIC